MLAYLCRRGIVVNLLVAWSLTVGASILAKLGLLFYQIKLVKKRGYKVKIRNLRDLMILLDLASLKNLIILIVPIINMFSGLQNFILFENDKESFLDEMLEQKLLVCRHKYYQSKRKHHFFEKGNENYQENISNLAFRIDALKNYREDLLAVGQNVHDIKGNIKVKKWQ